MNLDLKVVAFLLSLAATIFAVVLGVSVGGGEYLLPTLVLASFAGIALLANPKVAAAGAIATFSTAITLPGLPGQMKLFDAFALALLGIWILQTAMNYQRRIPFSRLDWIVVIFCIWIGFIGTVRGFGFLSFGGDMIGGFNYIKLLLSASLVITLPRIGMFNGGWKPAFLLAGLLAPAALVADLLILRGWAFEAVRIFVQTNVTGAEGTTFADPTGSTGRLISAGPAATGMVLALLCLVPMKRFFGTFWFLWVGLLSGIVFLSLLSGFRLMTILVVATAIGALLIQRQLTGPRAFALFFAGMVGVGLVYLFSNEFPVSVQRSISWLPGIEVSAIAQSDADQTVTWRLRVWSESLRYIPDYWLIGKGFSYDRLDFIAAIQNMFIDDLAWALVTGAYHNGWLSMLLTTGVFGMCLCLILLVGPVVRHWKRQFQPWRNAQFQLFHGVFLSVQVTSVLAFLIVYGDVHASFTGLFYQWAILETLSRSDAGSPIVSESVNARPEESQYEESMHS